MQMCSPAADIRQVELFSGGEVLKQSDQNVEVALKKLFQKAPKH
jgi:hypothetical protein